MNTITDPSKKTSINSLLNPEASSTSFSANNVPALPANQVQSSHPHHVNPYSTTFVNGSSFNLRAADWGMSDDSAKKKLDSGSRYHYHTSPDSSPIYPGHPPPRAGKSRDDGYGMEGPVWHAQQDVGYQPPVVAPMYSDERPALSGDYTSHNTYPPPYPEPAQPAMSQPWQATERASAPLVARGTVPDPPRYHNGYYLAPAAPHYIIAYPPLSPPIPQPQYVQPSPTQPTQPSQPPVPQQPQVPRVVQPPPEKRPLSEEDDSSSKNKRPKMATPTANANANVNANANTNANANAKTPGPSKRGYNAKKRNEAAQIAAQQAQMMPTGSYTPVPGEKGKQKEDDQPPPTGASTEATGAQALSAELQFARCMSNRYKNDLFPRCVSCTRRWAGDTCRFQGIRFFVKDGQRNIVGISFVEVQKADHPTMDFPSTWNIPLEPKHINKTKRTIAKALLPILRKEREHLKLPELIHRPRESEVRATCDTCMTSIFSTSWMCRLCGREACAECFSTVMDITTDRPGAEHAEVVALQVKREKHAHNNPFFLACTRRNEHQAKDFSPMSRFCVEDLDKAIREMEKLLKEEEETPMAVIDVGSEAVNGQPEASGQNGHEGMQQQPSLDVVMTNGSSAQPASETGSSLDVAVAPPETNGVAAPLNEAFVPQNLSETVANTPALSITRFKDGELTEDNFPAIWSLGQPLVVTGLLEKFKIQWTPEYFIEKHGGQGCLIIECQTEVNKRITVAEFFKEYGRYEGRTECWKLKDWPPSTDFKSAFPDLYDDFNRVVPVPSYVRRDGVFNLASHFPHNAIAPDLGPKMYNAMASTQTAGSKGSTRLHMDMADALNIMTYASLCADGSPGCAAWDLYRAEDSDKLRTFLTKRFGPGKAKSNGEGGSGLSGNPKRTGQGQDWIGVNDPIHGQQFYLDEDLRMELFKETGVKSYRYYQRPGEAIFIPAGCAHQVANLSDCIKVAIDFVSPENIERCERLTKEFREQNQRKVWKEDVLQLRTMMWFGWLSCRLQEGDGDEEVKESA